MKLCQKCINDIEKAYTSPVDLFPVDDQFPVRESECEFWAHKALRESERNLSEANYGALEAGEKNY